LTSPLYSGVSLVYVALRPEMTLAANSSRLLVGLPASMIVMSALVSSVVRTVMPANAAVNFSVRMPLRSMLMLSIADVSTVIFSTLFSTSALTTLSVPRTASE